MPKGTGTSGKANCGTGRSWPPTHGPPARVRPHTPRMNVKVPVLGAISRVLVAGTRRDDTLEVAAGCPAPGTERGRDYDVRPHAPVWTRELLQGFPTRRQDLPTPCACCRPTTYRDTSDLRSTYHHPRAESHRIMGWVGRDLRGSPSQNILLRRAETSSTRRGYPKPLSNLTWNVARDGTCTASLGNLFHCPTTLLRKKCLP